MSSANQAEVKQYTATFTYASGDLTVAHLSGPLEEMNYDAVHKAYTSSSGGIPVAHEKLLLPVGAHIINGTDSNQRIGNKIHIHEIRLKAIAKNTTNCAPCVKLSLISDLAVNGKQVISLSDLYECYEEWGSVVNTIPKISSVGRFNILKSSVFEVFNEATDSCSYLSWDITTSMDLWYRQAADNDTAGLFSTNSALYILVSVGSDSKCTLYGTYSILYTDK